MKYNSLIGVCVVQNLCAINLTAYEIYTRLLARENQVDQQINSSRVVSEHVNWFAMFWQFYHRDRANT